MKTNLHVLLHLTLWLIVFGALSCTPASADRFLSAPRDAGVQAIATVDQTATAAAEIIVAALAATPSPTSPAHAAASASGLDATQTVEAQTVATAVAATISAQSPTPNQIATQTAQAYAVETVVAATLTAQPIPTVVVLPTSTPVPTATLPTPNLAATQTTEANFMATSVAATLTGQPQATATHTPMPVRQVIAYSADEPTLHNLSSLWSLTAFRDLYAPGLQTYNVSITPTEDWQWSFAWCAIDSDTLQAILQPLTVTMLVDGMTLSNAVILQHQGVSNNRDQCYYWSTALTQWQPGAVVKLEIYYTLADAIDDGRQSYPAGQYQQVLFVNVR